MSDVVETPLKDPLASAVMTVVPIYDGLDYAYEILTFWCPGCESAHQVRHAEGQWNWNRDLNRPSITPAIKVVQIIAGKKRPKTLCHAFVAEGKWVYLSDSSHALAGQTVPLPALPEAYLLDQ